MQDCDVLDVHGKTIHRWQADHWLLKRPYLTCLSQREGEGQGREIEGEREREREGGRERDDGGGEGEDRGGEKGREREREEGKERGKRERGGGREEERERGKERGETEIETEREVCVWRGGGGAATRRSKYKNTQKTQSQLNGEDRSE